MSDVLPGLLADLDTEGKELVAAVEALGWWHRRNVEGVAVLRRI